MYICMVSLQLLLLCTPATYHHDEVARTRDVHRKLSVFLFCWNFIFFWIVYLDIEKLHEIWYTMLYGAITIYCPPMTCTNLYGHFSLQWCYMNVKVSQITDNLTAGLKTNTDCTRMIQDKLTKYCRRWHLILNVQKTKTMIFNPKFRVTEAVKTFTFHGDSIEECTKYKYLGVIFSSYCHRFKENTSHLKAKSIQAIIASNISVHSGVGNELPMQLFFKNFYEQVLPILDASEFRYQEKPIEDLEWVQLKYLKMSWVSARALPTWLYMKRPDNSRCTWGSKTNW